MRATLFGAFLGLVTFAVTAWMWRSGATQAAALTAEAALLIALGCIALIAVLDGPARLRRARVPINRAVPQAWWPRETDSLSLLAACAGAPLVIGAGAAVLLFR
ncbi:MAG: hypothetical protein E6J45_05065 [Chloroflexi bacterium]|nr:MAG: hypothetical protein E6J45_05065 [Chloroflexota bacterium]